MFIQRSSLRLCEGWHRLKGWRGSYVRDLMGHHLVIFHGRTPDDHNWYKWVDGHFRGSAERLKMAKVQLEVEATGGGIAWTSKSGQQDTNASAESSTHSIVGCSRIGESTLCMIVSAVEKQRSGMDGSSVLSNQKKGEADECVEGA